MDSGDLTAEGQEKLFEDLDDAHPLLSRCTRLDLSRRGLAEVFAHRAKVIAEAEGLDGPARRVREARQDPPQQPPRHAPGRRGWRHARITVKSDACQGKPHRSALPPVRAIAPRRAWWGCTRRRPGIVAPPSPRQRRRTHPLLHRLHLTLFRSSSVEMPVSAQFPGFGANRTNSDA